MKKAIGKKHKQKSCSNKIRYKTKNGGHIAMHTLKRKNLIFHKMKVYKCPYCKGWHVGRIKEIDYSQFERLK